MSSGPEERTSPVPLDQLRLLVDAQIDYAIFLLDTGGHVVTWNAGAMRMKGYDRGEILGEHFSRFYTPEDIERRYPWYELEVATREGRYEDEGWRLRKDGSRFWANVVITALRDEHGELVGFGKVTRDLTSRRLAEEQLRLNAAELRTANAELEQFRMLVGSVREYAIFILDPGGYIRTWNTGAEHLKGYTEDEAVGRHVSLFYTDEDRDRDHASHELAVAAREGRYEEEGWRVRKDGTRFWANVVITALRNERGTLVGFAKVTRDLSERREAQIRLETTAEELARSNAALDQFAAMAAHDMVEPLNTIRGLAEVAGRRYGERLDEDGRLLLSEIAHGAIRMRSRIDALLEYSRASQEEVEREPVALGDAVGAVVSALRARIAERGADVRYDANALPVVSADPKLLDSILQNLVANALKFSPAGEARVTVDAVADGRPGWWRISVTDNGIGIHERDHERVFAIFGRAHGEGSFAGTGLGLALCERLVHRHGGGIGVESEEGRGSRFWFTLPGA